MFFRDAKLDDYEKLQKYTGNILSAQYSFAYFYVFHKKHGVKLCFESDSLFVRVENYDDQEYMAFLMPIGNASFHERIDCIKSYAELHHKKVKICLATLKDMEELEINHISFEATAQRDRWDYLFTPHNVTNLSGKENAHKRAKYNRFIQRNSNASISRITHENVREIEAYHKLLLENGELYEDFAIENRELIKIFQSFDEIGCSGVMVIIDGKIEAYALGIPINKHVFDFVALKSNKSFDGLSVFIKVEFAKALKSYQYINYEEDLGIPGLRTVKTRLHPDVLLEKYMVLLR